MTKLTTVEDIVGEFRKEFGRFYFGEDANSAEAFDWEKGREQKCICSGNVEPFLRLHLTTLLEGIKEGMAERKQPEPEDINDGEDLFPRVHNAALDEAAAIIQRAIGTEKV